MGDNKIRDFIMRIINKIRDFIMRIVNIIRNFELGIPLSKSPANNEILVQ